MNFTLPYSAARQHGLVGYEYISMDKLLGPLRKALSRQSEAIDREKYSAVDTDLDDDAPTMPTRHRRRQISLTIPALLLSILASLTLGVLATLCVQRLRPGHVSPHRPEHTGAPSSGNHSDDATSSLAQSAAQSILVSPCGSTPAEARAAGCHFDIISFTWLAGPCYDAGLSEAFAAETRDGDWYVDEGRTQPLTRDEVLSGEFTGVYVGMGYHLRHCTAMWKKMHRALLEEAGVEVWDGGEGGEGMGLVGRASRRGAVDDIRGLMAMDAYIWSYKHTLHCEEVLLSGWNDTHGLLKTEVRIKYPDCGIALP